MDLIENTDEKVSLKLSRQEFGLIYGLILEMTEQWRKLDSAAISASKEEAVALHAELDRVARQAFK